MEAREQVPCTFWLQSSLQRKQEQEAGQSILNSTPRMRFANRMHIRESAEPPAALAMMVGRA